MDGAPPDPPPIPGRGAPSNHRPTRFNLPEREEDGDWLDQQQCVDGLQPKPRTTVGIITPRKIITYNQSPDIGFDRSINSYAGCDQLLLGCTTSVEQNGRF